jgi:hypothetical protein
VYALGVSFTSGWRPIGAIVLAAFAVGATASIPYLGWLDIASPSTVSIWLLMLIVGVAAHLAARSRGWSLAGRLAYTLMILAIAASVSVIKYLLTH